MISFHLFNCSTALEPNNNIIYHHLTHLFFFFSFFFYLHHYGFWGLFIGLIKDMFMGDPGAVSFNPLSVKVF